MITKEELIKLNEFKIKNKNKSFSDKDAMKYKLKFDYFNLKVLGRIGLYPDELEIILDMIKQDAEKHLNKK